MINDSMNYKRITIFAKDTQNDMKRFIGHTILILLAKIFLFCPTTMSQNNPYKINDQLYSYLLLSAKTQKGINIPPEAL